MGTVVTLGEVLVEIMALDKGRGFDRPLRLQGPYPSGAPAIFIDQVAKMGQACKIIACVGDDDFGRLNVARLAADGVGTEAVRTLPGRATGTAFVRYGDDGQRDFVFNITDSANGRLRLTAAAAAVLTECAHLHISGSSLFSAAMVNLVGRAIEIAKTNGATVSFDPNARRDALRRPDARKVFRHVLQCCDLYLPSGAELTLLTDAQDEKGAVAELLALGVQGVAVKQGPAGSTYFDKHGKLDRPAFAMTEVDPTGAGDCFDAAFVTARLRGHRPEECLSYANAAGALAISELGPMEGTSTMAQVEELLASPQARRPGPGGTKGRN